MAHEYNSIIEFQYPEQLADTEPKTSTTLNHPCHITTTIKMTSPQCKSMSWHTPEIQYYFLTGTVLMISNKASFGHKHKFGFVKKIPSFLMWMENNVIK